MARGSAATFTDAAVRSGPFRKYLLISQAGPFRIYLLFRFLPVFATVLVLSIYMWFGHCGATVLTPHGAWAFRVQEDTEY